MVIDTPRALELSVQRQGGSTFCSPWLTRRIRVWRRAHTAYAARDGSSSLMTGSAHRDSRTQTHAARARARRRPSCWSTLRYSRLTAARSAMLLRAAGGPVGRRCPFCGRRTLASAVLRLRVDAVADPPATGLCRQRAVAHAFLQASRGAAALPVS